MNTSWLRVCAPFFFALLSGFFLVLATPQVGFFVVAPLALIPYFVSVLMYTSRLRLVLLTLLAFTPYCVIMGEPLFRLSGTWWIGPAYEHATLTTVLYVCVVGLMIFFVSLSYVLPVLVVRSYRLRLPVWLTVAFATVVVEYIRTNVFIAGYSWGVLGYLLTDTMYIKHIASLVGVYGLTFVYVAWSVWGAQCLTRLVKCGLSWGAMRNALVGQGNFYESVMVVALLIATLLYGVLQELRVVTPDASLRVATIASNIRTDESIQPGAYRTYRALLLEALGHEPDLILTPENAFPYFMIDESTMELSERPSVYLREAGALYADFLATTKKYPTTIFAVALHSHRDKELFNSIALYKDGAIVSMYHKRRPVPFTEYAPFGIPLPLFQQFSRGARMQDFGVGNLVFSGFICSEIGITTLAYGGATIILSPSNDSALVSRGIAPLHHQLARMRAIESGAYVLRASKGGISSVIDPHGHVLASLEGKPGVLVVDIGVRSPDSR